MRRISVNRRPKMMGVFAMKFKACGRAHLGEIGAKLDFPPKKRKKVKNIATGCRIGLFYSAQTV
jgi:hypothetical protein